MTELFLNLFWAVLAVSALYAWTRRRSVSSSRPGYITLACLLVLLFPVISASDDLHAMRPEIEDASANRKSLRHATVDRTATPHTFHSPAFMARTSLGSPWTEVWGLVVVDSGSVFSASSRSVQSGRAPPSFLFA